MTRNEAGRLISTSCTLDPPDDEEAAVEGLMQYEESDFDGVGEIRRHVARNEER